MATILYFIKDAVPTKAEKVDILGLGFDVCQRNARFADKFEPCDGVIFSKEIAEDADVREYFKGVPDGASVIAKMKKDRELHFANLQAELEASIKLDEETDKEKTEDKKPLWGS